MPSSQAPLGISAHASLPREGDVLVDKFRIERVLGEGGMCVVYAARHLQLEGMVAIKILRPDVVAEAANPDEIVQRFLREGVAACQISSEHVVRTFDVGTLPSGDPFLVMEHLDGHDLDALLTTHGPLPIEAAVDYVLQAGEAIAEAHSLGIIHRDLKPANLFLTHRPDGSPMVKVLDFGISKIVQKKSARKLNPSLTGTANVLGSPHYMSPEQLRASRDVDIRTDIWSLGTIIHELLSGEPPFKGNTMPEICANILKEPPPPLAPLRPEVPLALQTIVLRCLEKDPACRFGNMGELATALSEFATPAGRASAQRIAGIARSHVPDQGGILVAPPHEGPTWGSTDPSWDAIPVTAAGGPRRRRAVLAVFGLVMTAMGALLLLEFGGFHANIARWFDHAASVVTPAPRVAEQPASATVRPPSFSNAEVPGAPTLAPSIDPAALLGANGNVSDAGVVAVAPSPAALIKGSRPAPQREMPASTYVPRPTPPSVPSTPAVTAPARSSANQNGNGDGLFEERK